MMEFYPTQNFMSQTTLNVNGFYIYLFIIIYYYLFFYFFLCSIFNKNKMYRKK